MNYQSIVKVVLSISEVIPLSREVIRLFFREFRSQRGCPNG